MREWATGPRPLRRRAIAFGYDGGPQKYWPGEGTRPTMLPDAGGGACCSRRATANSRRCPIRDGCVQLSFQQQAGDSRKRSGSDLRGLSIQSGPRPPTLDDEFGVPFLSPISMIHNPHPPLGGLPGFMHVPSKAGAPLAEEPNHRLLIIDDNSAIHQDFRKILGGPAPAELALDTAGETFFGAGEKKAPSWVKFEIDSAFSGQEGLAMVQRATAEGRPYGMAFVDVRMPPGWDGVETVGKIWKVDPEIQVVICTAYSDYSWEEMVGKIGQTDNLAILRKPFHSDEALQLAHMLTRKWTISRCLRAHIHRLDQRAARGVTTMKLAEDGMRASETRYRRLFESSKDGILILDAETGMIVDVNPFLVGLLGFSHEQFLGKAIWELGFLKDIVASEHKFAELREKAYVRYEHLPLESADGRSIDVEFVSNVYLVDGAKVIQCNIRDISARFKAERALRASASFTDDILNSLTAEVVVVDGEGRITAANEAWMRFSRESGGGERLGQNYLEACARSAQRFGDSDAESAGRGIRSVLDGAQGAFSLEYRCGSPARPRWFEMRVSPLRGVKQGVVISHEEITERKQAEADLREVKIEKESVAESNRLKSEFLANMSHELRTPLNAIIGFAEVMIDGRPGPLNDKQKEYLGDVHASAQHLLQLINDVLDLAKIEAGKISLHPETFSPVKAIENVHAVVHGLALKGRVALRCAVSPEVGPLELDLSKFKQICYNLLSNAIKFTDAGGSVHLDLSPKGEDRFEIRVADTGIGIKQDDLPRLFREFEQLEGGMARRFEGTGLGLALTKKLVEAQGGSIRVESESGKGSAFTVNLPRRAAR